MGRIGRFSENLFQTQVPLLSSNFIVLISLASSICIGVMLAVVIPARSLSPSNLILIAFFLGTVIQLVLIGLLTMRFQYTEGSMDDTVSRIYRRAILRNVVHIWSRKSLKPYAVVFLTPTHRAVVLSTSMIHLMKRMPNEAEVLLAEKILCADRQNSFLRYLTSIFTFTVLFLITYLYISYMRITGTYLYNLYPTIFLILLGVPILFGLIRSLTWARGSEVVFVAQEWGMHPQIAEIQLTADHLLSDEEIQSILWQVRLGEEHSRFNRRIVLIILINIPILVMLFIVFLFFAYSGMYTIGIGLLFLVPTVLFFIIYFSFKKRDNNAQEELWYDAEIIHDPIWLD